NILQAQDSLEAWRVVFLLDDDSAVRLIDRRREQAAGQEIEEPRGVDAGLADQGEGFAQALENGRDQKVARELDDVGRGSIRSQDESLLAQRVVERTTLLHSLGRTVAN